MLIIHILESDENYLEQVLMLQNKLGRVRQADVCAAMGYARATVSVKFHDLARDGYLTLEEDGAVVLTQTGRQIAEAIYEKHCVISAMLMALGTREETAYADACKIEHDISDETYRNIKKHYDRYRGKKLPNK